jgi:hypothetical protein
VIGGDNTTEKAVRDAAAASWVAPRDRQSFAGAPRTGFSPSRRAVAGVRGIEVYKQNI